MNRLTIEFEEDVNTLSHRDWQRAGGGLLKLSRLLLGNFVIIICTEEYERNIDLVSTSSPSLLSANTDLSFISTEQENYGDD